MRNLLNIQVLVALAAGDGHAYAIIEQLKRDGVLAATMDERHVYRILKRLVEDGLVSVDAYDGRNIYRLLPQGRRRLRAVQSELQDTLKHMNQRL